jgi:hypothetical protein
MNMIESRETTGSLIARHRAIEAPATGPSGREMLHFVRASAHSNILAN